MAHQPNAHNTLKKRAFYFFLIEGKIAILQRIDGNKPAQYLTFAGAKVLLFSHIKKNGASTHDLFTKV